MHALHFLPPIVARPGQDRTRRLDRTVSQRAVTFYQLVPSLLLPGRCCTPVYMVDSFACAVPAYSGMHFPPSPSPPTLLLTCHHFSDLPTSMSCMSLPICVLLFPSVGMRAYLFFFLLPIWLFVGCTLTCHVSASGASMCLCALPSGWTVIPLLHTCNLPYMGMYDI